MPALAMVSVAPESLALYSSPRTLELDSAAVLAPSNSPTSPAARIPPNVVTTMMR